MVLIRSMTMRNSEVDHYGPQPRFNKKAQNTSFPAAPKSGLSFASATESSLSESVSLLSLTSDSTSSGSSAANSFEQSSSSATFKNKSSASATFIDRSSTSTIFMDKSSASATPIEKSSTSTTSVEKLSSVPSASGPPTTTDLQELERQQHRPRSYSEIEGPSFSELTAMSREELKAALRALGDDASDSDYEPYDGSDYAPDVDYIEKTGEFAPGAGVMGVDFGA